MNAKETLAAIKLRNPFQKDTFSIIWGVYGEKYGLILNEKVGDKVECRLLTDSEATEIIEKYN